MRVVFCAVRSYPHVSHSDGNPQAAAKEKPFKLSDGGGLHLLVQPNGSKLWRFRYRFAGRENMLTLGAYPTVSLASARQKRDDARRQLADGADPRRQAETRQDRCCNGGSE